MFNFHQEKEALRDYVNKVFAAAVFVQYEAVEEELVGRIVMKLHPHCFSQRGVFRMAPFTESFNLCRWFN